MVLLRKTGLIITVLRLVHSNLHQIASNLLYSVSRNIQFLKVNVLNVSLILKDSITILWHWFSSHTQSDIITAVKWLCSWSYIVWIYRFWTTMYALLAVFKEFLKIKTKYALQQMILDNSGIWQIKMFAILALQIWIYLLFKTSITY